MSFFAKCLAASLLLAVAAAAGRSAPPKKSPPREFLPPTLSWLRQVEAAQMLGAIASGQPPSSGGMGWFHPGQSALRTEMARRTHGQGRRRHR